MTCSNQSYIMVKIKAVIIFCIVVGALSIIGFSLQKRMRAQALERTEAQRTTEMTTLERSTVPPTTPTTPEPVVDATLSSGSTKHPCLKLLSGYSNKDSSDHATVTECPKCHECGKVDCPELVCPKLECPKLECPKVKCKAVVKPKCKKCNNDYIPRKKDRFAHSVCSHDLERIFSGDKRTMNQFRKYLMRTNMYDDFCVEMNSRFWQRILRDKVKNEKKKHECEKCDYTSIHNCGPTCMNYNFGLCD